MPVLTGIGHEVDYTVLDMVAHKALKTPTAVADFLIEHNLQFESDLVTLGNSLNFYIQNKLFTEGGDLSRIESFLQFQTAFSLKNQIQKCDRLEDEIPKIVAQMMKYENVKLVNALEIINLMSVESTLKRGFSVTRKNGKLIARVNEVHEGDVIETQITDGV